MRRLRYAVAASLDGYIADPSGGYDWIVADPEIDFAAYAEKIDTLVMGRGTYEVTRAVAANGSEGGDPLAGWKTYVVSTTMDPADHPDVTVVHEGVEQLVSDLKAQEGKDIWLFGGGALFRTLLAAGLVDRVEVGVIPVLLGDGVPLLARGEPLRTRLSLHSVEQFPTGVLLIKYDVTG